jgi:hypothetical protein
VYVVELSSSVIFIVRAGEREREDERKMKLKKNSSQAVLRVQEPTGIFSLVIHVFLRSSFPSNFLIIN